MNHILNDLTYCDGRFAEEAQATFSDSPSRLKLRSNTFQGIKTSLEKRRTPAKNNDFFIPSAAMPQMNVVEDGGQGGASKEVANVGITHRNPEELATNVGYKDSKKLKVGSKQFEGLNISRAKNLKEVAPAVETKENITEEVKPMTAEIKPELPKAQELPKVELPKVEPVKESVKAEEPVATPIPVQTEVNEMPSPVMQTVDNSTITNESEKENANNSVEEKVDEFANLQKVTEKYQQTVKEYDEAKLELNSAEEAFAESKRQLEASKKQINDKKEEIINQRNVIDTTKKEIAQIEEEIEKVREEIQRRTIAIEKANEKKIREKRDITSKTKQVKEGTLQNHQEVESDNKTFKNMDKESQALTNEENEVLSKKASVRSELERIEEILKATTLPEEAEEYMKEATQPPSIEVENRDKIIAFPNRASDIVNEEAVQKSIGAYKAA